jgi:acetoacetyl-CoA synthetase
VTEDIRLGQILWQPDAERIADTAMARFAQANGFAPSDYAGLHDWSVHEPEAFHARLWEELGIIGSRGDRVYAPASDIRDVRFFPDAALNYAENMLQAADDRLAIIAHRDDGTRRTITRAQLRDLVSRCTQAMRADGVGVGDRVAAIVTNDIEAIALYLATAATGAVWASCSPDFGPGGAADRLCQIDPKLIVAVPRYGYAGKSIDTSASINAVAAGAPAARVILIDTPAPGARFDGPTTLLDAWIAPFAPQPIDYVRQGFDAPLAILFSSGTTGKPKGIVHGAGRLLLAHRKEHVLHCDLRADDRFFYYTTCGWMMWNWLVSGLASEAVLVTFDGNPAYPEQTRLPDLIDSEAVTLFGTSAKYIDACRKAGIRPIETHAFNSLRTICSTGSPLLPDGFAHIYADWKKNVHLASISGGTDICACFLGGVPTQPVRAGELQAPMLGLDVATYSADGHSVEGVSAELVCRNAHLSMPVGFLGDHDGSRYKAAYFERFTSVWAHGDFVEKRRDGGYVIHGRSDTTLNPGGVRIGTAEIYRQVETLPEITEAVVAGQNWDGDQRVILFVRLASGVVLDEALEKRIRQSIRTGATPRHVPARILAVTDIPRTRSGKIAEAAVRDAINGRADFDARGIANPDAIAQYRDRAELAL